MKQTSLAESITDSTGFFRSDYRVTSDTAPYGEVMSSFEGLGEHSGSYQVISIRRGLAITLCRFCGGSPFSLNFEIAGAPVEFACWLSGEGRCKMHGLGPTPSDFLNRAGTMTVSYAPGTSGCCMALGDEDICMVCLLVDPVLLSSLVGKDASTYPAQLRQSFTGDEKGKFTINGRITPAMQTACHQILTCPFVGGCRDLFLESKALELLSLQLNAFSSCPRGVSRGLTRQETDRIHDARDCLISDLKNSPTIARLARLTGINETKLKSGFRSVYGTTIFDYLRRHKMEVARCSLEEGIKNVSEVAYDVGYANVSHFIRAYRAVFGVNPGEFARKSRGVM